MCLSDRTMPGKKRVVLEKIDLNLYVFGFMPIKMSSYSRIPDFFSRALHDSQAFDECVSPANLTISYGPDFVIRYVIKEILVNGVIAMKKMTRQ